VNGETLNGKQAQPEDDAPAVQRDRRGLGGFNRKHYRRRRLDISRGMLPAPDREERQLTRKTGGASPNRSVLGYLAADQAPGSEGVGRRAILVRRSDRR